MLEIWTTEEEATHLKARFSGINKAEFARKNKVPGGASMLSQHLSGNRPLNLAAATAYAKGFGVALHEISPRLANEVSEAAKAAEALSNGAFTVPSDGASAADAAPSPPLPQALKTVAIAFAATPSEKRRALLEVLAAYAANPQAEGGSLAYLQGELAKAAPEAENQSRLSAKQVQPVVETHAFAGKPQSTEQNINPHKTGVFSRK